MATETEPLDEQGTPLSQTAEGLVAQGLIERIRQMPPEQQQHLYSQLQQPAPHSDEQTWVTLGI